MPRHARPTTVFPVGLREVEVVRIVDVTPGMRRITLAGAQLGAFTSAGGFPVAPFESRGFDDDIRLLFPYPGQTEPVLPVQVEGHLDWPKEPRPLYRVYSVRRWDPEAGELDVDFVKHGVGIATTWAYRAAVGDRIHFFGPHSSAGLPQDADWLLVAGDDTALPAIGRLLDELPENTRAQVFIEVAEHAHVQPLRELSGVIVTWLVRPGPDAGTTTLLADAVRAAEWWEGRPFAWLAGEQAVVRDLRRHLVEDRGLPKPDIDFTGYWKRSAVVALESDAAVPDPDKNPEAFERFHDLAELVPPIAIRVAAELGIAELITRGVTDVRELAARTGSDERALGKLLRYLHAIDLLTETAPGRYALTEVGEFLAMDYWAEYLDPTGVAARQEAGILRLAESVRTGAAAYASVTGRTFAEVEQEPDYREKLWEQTAGYAEYLAPAIAASPALTGVEHLVIRSNGPGPEAREAVAAHPGLRVTISAPAAQAAWLRRDLPATIPDAALRERIAVVDQEGATAAPTGDAVLLVHMLGPLSDTDAVAALRAAVAGLSAEGRVLLIEHTLDSENLDEHDAEADLYALTREGTGLRTEPELQAVIEAAGLRLARTSTIGWGLPLRELTLLDR